MQTDTGTETLRIGKYEFSSRLFVGTGKYPSLEIMQQAHLASGAQVVDTGLHRVRRRRVDEHEQRVGDAEPAGDLR